VSSAASRHDDRIASVLGENLQHFCCVHHDLCSFGRVPDPVVMPLASIVTPPLPPIVIARSAATKQSRASVPRDCFVAALLAMTMATLLAITVGDGGGGMRVTG
jgi:hypothetical protein